MSFYTDTIQQDSRFNSADRIDDLALLEPNMRRKVEAIIADAAANDIMMMVFETYRSQDRQGALFHQGVTQLQTVGVHHYGLACDIVFVHNGEPSWTGDFSHLAHLAKSHGLIWGGDWGHPDRPTSFPDNDHVQWVTIARQPALFRGDWYPADDYDPYADG